MNASLKNIEKKISDALTIYSGSRYATINSGLRKGVSSASDKKVVELIDLAMVPGKSSKIVYRAAAIPEITQAMKTKSKLEGITFTDKAFVSTTTDKKMMYMYTSGHMQGEEVASLFVIHLAVGDAWVDMEDFSQFGNKEGEILLARGTKFKVTEVENVKEKEQYRDYLSGGKIKNRTVKYQHIHLKII